MMKVLVETLDLQTLLLGTLLPLIPALGWVALQPLIFDVALARELVGKTSPGRGLWITSIVVLVFAYLLLGPWPGTIYTVLLLGGGFALGAAVIYVLGVARALRAGAALHASIRTRLQFADSRPIGRTWHVVALPLIAVAVIFVVPGQMWLPLEKVVTADDTTTAYVLQDEGGWATLLNENRTVSRVQSSTITSRTICEQAQYESLLTIWSGAFDSAFEQCS